MAIIEDRLSTEPVPGAFLAPDDRVRPNLTTDYELGGVALEDASQGFRLKTWVATLSGNDVVVEPEDGSAASQVVTSDTDITELALSFDQNMRPVIAYVADTACKLYWYDAQASGFVTTEFAGCESPRLTLDDKRQIQNTLGRTDTLFVYIRAGGLYYRQQRDRYGVEHTLIDPVGGSRIRRLGMADNLRVQIELEGGGNFRAIQGSEELIVTAGAAEALNGATLNARALNG